MTTTTREAIGADDRQFRAAWDRIMAAAGTQTPRHATTRPEPIRRDYSVQVVTGDDIRREAARWRKQWAIPEWVARDSDGWAANLAQLVNGRAGYMVRRYWRAVVDEVFVVARQWPMLADLNEAAQAVARREGSA